MKIIYFSVYVFIKAVICILAKSLISPTVNEPVSQIIEAKSEWICVRSRFLTASSGYLLLTSVFLLNRFLKPRSHSHEDTFSNIVLFGYNERH